MQSFTARHGIFNSFLWYFSAFFIAMGLITHHGKLFGESLLENPRYGNLIFEFVVWIFNLILAYYITFRFRDYRDEFRFSSVLYRRNLILFVVAALFWGFTVTLGNGLMYSFRALVSILLSWCALIFIFFLIRRSFSERVKGAILENYFLLPTLLGALGASFYDRFGWAQTVWDWSPFSGLFFQWM